jgi:hypothetical protein
MHVAAASELQRFVDRAVIPALLKRFVSEFQNSPRSTEPTGNSDKTANARAMATAQKEVTPSSQTARNTD